MNSVGARDVLAPDGSGARIWTAADREAVLTALAARVSRIEPTGPPVRHHHHTLRVFASWRARLVR